VISLRQPANFDGFLPIRYWRRYGGDEVGMTIGRW
jgi:hypothetical protein